jgi:hypothetical protein
MSESWQAQRRPNERLPRIERQVDPAGRGRGGPDLVHTCVLADEVEPLGAEIGTHMELPPNPGDSSKHTRPVD